MNMKYTLFIACAVAFFSSVGCAQAANATMAVDPWKVRTGQVAKTDIQPVKPPEHLYEWEHELQQDTAARSLIREQLYGIQSGVNLDGFYNDYHSWY